MAVLNAGNVATKQAGALFNVTLGEFLFLAQFAEAITNNHGGIIPLRRLEGKQGIPRRCESNPGNNRVEEVQAGPLVEVQVWFPALLFRSA